MPTYSVLSFLTPLLDPLKVKKAPIIPRNFTVSQVRMIVTDTFDVCGGLECYLIQLIVILVVCIAA